MGHPHALVVNVQQVLLVNELRGQLGEDAAIPLQDLVKLLLVANVCSCLLGCLGVLGLVLDHVRILSAEKIFLFINY
jgi:hypothetical protein